MLVVAHRRTTKLFCLLWLVYSGESLFGIDRDRKISQLYHTSWTLKEGAPGQVHALAQTADGYLWLGTANGLFRFDGVRFEAYKPPSGQPFPPRNVYSLLAVPDGGLWVGFWAGGVSFLKDGAVKTYSEQDGLPSRPVLAFARDRHGVTWIAAGASGLVRLEGSRWQRIEADWNFSGIALSVFEDSRGTLWVGTVDSVFFLPAGARKFQTGANQLKHVMKITEASDGTIWMAETERSVRPVPLPARITRLQPSEIHVGSQSILFDRQGSLWAMTLGDGIRRIPSPELLDGVHITKSSPNADIFTQKQGLTSDYLFCVIEDREGNIWTGSNIGLDRFRQSALVAAPLPDSPVSALVAAETGGVWAAGGMRPLMRIRGGNISRGDRRLLNISLAYGGPEGVLWLATPKKLLRLAKPRKGSVASRIVNRDLSGSADLVGMAIPSWSNFDERLLLDQLDLQKYHLPPVTPEARIRAMTADRYGRLWLSMAEKGVFRLDGSGTSLEDFGGPKGPAISAFTGPDGRLWFGFADNTVSVLDNERVHTFKRKEGLSIGNVLSFGTLDQMLWVGGDDGLALFRGVDFRPLIPADGEPFNSVTGIVGVPGDGLWISESRGVIHIPVTEIEKFQRNFQYNVAFEIYGLLDGLPAELQKTPLLPTAVRASDGTIWFATSSGLVWVNPERLSKNALPPLVSIETITANGKSYNPLKRTELPARTDNLQIGYTGLSLTVPERVRFRYRLEGLGEDWQDVGTRREAIYTNLGPGTYRFRVIASNNDNVWNETGAALDLVIVPAYYQTLWFKTLCVMAGGGVIWLVYLLRVRQVTTQIQLRLGERLAERGRIARELHDTLLQGFQGLMLHFEAVMKQLPTQGPARQMMEKVLHTADEVLLEGRHRVRDLRSETVPPSELSTLLAHCGEELAEDNDTAFKVAVVGSPRALDPIVRDEVYRIGREALVNAFRHAKASTVEIEILYNSDGLQLRIRDDGRGIDQETLNQGVPGHWGLSGMRERAQRLSGRLNFWSRPGAGTEIDLTIPAK